MFWGDFIDLDSDPDWSNFVDPDHALLESTLRRNCRLRCRPCLGLVHSSWLCFFPLTKYSTSARRTVPRLSGWISTILPRVNLAFSRLVEYLYDFPYGLPGRCLGFRIDQILWIQIRIHITVCKSTKKIKSVSFFLPVTNYRVSFFSYVSDQLYILTAMYRCTMYRCALYRCALYRCTLYRGTLYRCFMLMYSYL